MLSSRSRIRYFRICSKGASCLLTRLTALRSSSATGPAVTGDSRLAAAERLADAPQLRPINRIEHHRAALGEPVALAQRHPDRIVKRAELLAERRRAGDRDPELAAEAGANLQEHQLIRQ